MRDRNGARKRTGGSERETGREEGREGEKASFICIRTTPRCDQVCIWEGDGANRRRKNDAALRGKKNEMIMMKNEAERYKELKLIGRKSLGIEVHSSGRKRDMDKKRD